MPANLTPDYLAADKKFKAAATPQDKLAALEEMLATIPKHKGTEKMQADLKRRIAKLRDEMQRRKGAARGKPFYHVDKEGAGQVVLIGAPNVGKSMLLRALSHAEPEVADYPFTTRVPLPGMVEFEDVQVQLVDLPPITVEFREGWLYGIIRTADVAALVVDLSSEDLLSQTETVLSLLSEANIRLVRSPGQPGEKRAVVIANKLDVLGAGGRLERFREFIGELAVIPVSAAAGTGLDGLRQVMFDLLHVIRVYSKPPGKKADRGTPFILKRGATVLDAAEAIHKDFVEKLKYARLWGREHYQGQMVGRDHVLEDGDIIEIHA
ncbi:MAG: TGS domain-containing protein [Armatimonadetes bacterium]|nr:TGS domain-containing protein [Armatimonadota bacterium]